MGGKPGFPPQPYFKNPSYYPDDQRDKAKTPNPPPPAQKIDPLPGGRLPLVQRRSSPAPFDRSSGRHSPSNYRSAVPKRRRGIVEDVYTVRASGRYTFLFFKNVACILWTKCPNFVIKGFERLA